MSWLGERAWLRGRDPGPERGHDPGVTILEEAQMSEREKAPKDGVYTLGRGRFRIRKGDPLPPGATFVDLEEELKQLRGARGSRGPAETTKSAGPAEQAKREG